MKAPEHFEVLDGYCCYRLVGHGPLEDAVKLVVEAIAYCREQGTRNLLVDTTKWTGHASPSTLERYTVAEAFTHAARSAVKLALVVRPEMMDPDKFEVTVARNRGLIGDVFVSEKEAVEWLLRPYSG